MLWYLIRPVGVSNEFKNSRHNTNTYILKYSKYLQNVGNETADIDQIARLDTQKSRVGYVHPFLNSRQRTMFVLFFQKVNLIIFFSCTAI